MIIEGFFFRCNWCKMFENNSTLITSQHPYPGMPTVPRAKDNETSRGQSGMTGTRSDPSDTVCVLHPPRLTTWAPTGNAVFLLWTTLQNNKASRTLKFFGKIEWVTNPKHSNSIPVSQLVCFSASADNHMCKMCSPPPYLATWVPIITSPSFMRTRLNGLRRQEAPLIHLAMQEFDLHYKAL